MYICWTASAIRYSAHESCVIVGSNGDILTNTSTPIHAAATNVRAVATLAEAVAWVKDGTTSGVSFL
jgi:hypothetical protein